MSYIALDKMFFRQQCKISSRFENPTFLRHLRGILKRCFQSVFHLCLEDYLAKMSKNCLFEMSFMMMIMMMMIMNCFCAMVDRRKAFSLISSRDHCQRSSPSRISDTPRAEFEPAQNLSSDLVEWSCAVVITTKPLHLLDS